MKHAHKIHVLLLAIAGVFAAAASHARLAAPGDSRVAFHAIGPSGLKIDGTTNELGVNEASEQVSVVVPLRGLDTKIELRNKHMRDNYLETDKYPTAELVVARSALKTPDAAPVSGEADGIMKLHGREHAVRFKYDASRLERAGARYQVNGSVRLDIRDYGIKEPSFMGASVKPEVEVVVSFTVSEQ